jgi:hypothetical protein
MSENHVRVSADPGFMYGREGLLRLLRPVFILFAALQALPDSVMLYLIFLKASPYPAAGAGRQNAAEQEGTAYI